MAEQALAGVGLLQALGEEELRRLEQRCRRRRCRAGERVFERGSESRDVYFVLAGAVDILDIGFGGREIVHATVKTGDYFGELAALDGERRSASAVAETDTLLALMPAPVFEELLRRRPEVTLQVLRRLARMVRLGDVRVLELTTLPAGQRVAAELLRLAEPDAAGTGLWVVRPLPPIRHIASRAGTTRETAARALSQLYAGGLARRKGRNLYLLDRQRLERETRLDEAVGAIL